MNFHASSDFCSIFLHLPVLNFQEPRKRKTRFSVAVWERLIPHSTRECICIVSRRRPWVHQIEIEKLNSLKFSARQRFELAQINTAQCRDLPGWLALSERAFVPPERCRELLIKSPDDAQRPSLGYAANACLMTSKSNLNWAQHFVPFLAFPLWGNLMEFRWHVIGFYARKFFS